LENVRPVMRLPPIPTLPRVFLYDERYWGAAFRRVLKTTHAFIAAVEVTYDDLVHRTRGPLQVLSGLSAHEVTRETCETVPHVMLAVEHTVTAPEFADLVGVGPHQLYQMCGLIMDPSQNSPPTRALADEIRRRRVNAGELYLLRDRDEEILREGDNDTLDFTVALNPVFEGVPAQELAERLRVAVEDRDAEDKAWDPVADRRMRWEQDLFDFRAREGLCTFYEPVPHDGSLVDVLVEDDSECWLKCVVIASSDSSSHPVYPRVPKDILALAAEVDMKAQEYVTNQRREREQWVSWAAAAHAEGNQEYDDIVHLSMATILGFVPGYAERAAAHARRQRERRRRDNEAWGARLMSRPRRPRGLRSDLDPLERAALARPFGSVSGSPVWAPQPPTPPVLESTDDNSDSKLDYPGLERESKEADGGAADAGRRGGRFPRGMLPGMGKGVLVTAPEAGASVGARLRRRPPTPSRRWASGLGAGGGKSWVLG